MAKQPLLLTVTEIVNELDRARKLYPQPFCSTHDGFGKLEEEVYELWDHVRVKPAIRDRAAMRKEAVQVAAMAIRFIEDICDQEGRSTSCAPEYR